MSVEDNRGGSSGLSVHEVTSKPEIAQVLRSSHDDIIRELGRLDSLIAHSYEEIRRLQDRRKPWEEALVHIEALLNINGQIHSRPASMRVANSSSSITDAAFALLQRTHEPTHYKQIAAKLQEDNVHIPGKNPSATLLSRISRDKRFKRSNRRGVYSLSTWRTRSKNAEPKKRPGRT